MAWVDARRVPVRNFVCGYCGNDVAPDDGYIATQFGGAGEKVLRQISICHKCRSPTYFDAKDVQFPGALAGENVEGIDAPSVAELYREARRAFSAGAFTASTMACRKVLMNVAVAKGATANQGFVQYVEWLDANRFIPPDGKAWVDHIRKIGNEANHEIHMKSQDDAEELLTFTGMLLKFVYEMPSRLKKRLPK